jgi:hypothetical protein
MDCGLKPVRKGGFLTPALKGRVSERCVYTVAPIGEGSGVRQKKKHFTPQSFNIS